MSRNNAEWLGNKVIWMSVMAVVTFVLPLIFAFVWGVNEYFLWIVLILINFLTICLLVLAFHQKGKSMKEARNTTEWLGHRVIQLLLIIIPLFVVSVLFTFIWVTTSRNRWIVMIVLDVMMLLILTLYYNSNLKKARRRLV